VDDTRAGADQSTDHLVKVAEMAPLSDRVDRADRPAPAAGWPALMADRHPKEVVGFLIWTN
jgi:hypothetical protein